VLHVLDAQLLDLRSHLIAIVGIRNKVCAQIFFDLRPGYNVLHENTAEASSPSATLNEEPLLGLLCFSQRRLEVGKPRDRALIVKVWVGRHLFLSVRLRKMQRYLSLLF
jgi:hypothetical protein